MGSWTRNAIERIEADYNRSADTHLLKLDVGHFAGIDLYLKDESTHPTGSLKHRLARSLFIYALANGKITPGTTLVEASSGSTAVSEAYFAQLIGVAFIAVMPETTAQSKVEQIKRYGGVCHFVASAAAMAPTAEALAKQLNGYFLDQFTFAERATDWRGNNNIAQSLYQQMRREPHPIPRTIVMSAGTGGTSATLGRYIRYTGRDTKLVVADPEHSVFYQSYVTGDLSLSIDSSSRIEGIGRPRVEPSFLPDVIDDMVKVPDAASVATIHWLERQIGRKAGPSTGTNLFAALSIALDMMDKQQTGSIVTLMCDNGDRYLDTYYNHAWVQQNIGDVSVHDHFFQRLA